MDLKKQLKKMENSLKDNSTELENSNQLEIVKKILAGLNQMSTGLSNVPVGKQQELENEFTIDLPIDEKRRLRLQLIHDV